MSRPLRTWIGLLCLALAAGTIGAQETPGPVMTTAAEVRALTPAAAAQRRPVRLRGHLILVTNTRNALVLLDRTEGIYVDLAGAARERFQLGDELEVSGETDAGDFAPIVRALRVERRGPGEWPRPRPTSIAELNAGGFDAAWVELRGIVRACRPAPRLRLPAPRESWLVMLAQGDDRIEVQINAPITPADWVDAEVRLRGVVFNVHNANRQFVRASVQVADPAMVQVLSPPPSDPFALPVQALGDVLRFSPGGFTGRRVHVRGVVTGHQDGRTLWLRDGERGMRVASAQSGNLSPGDYVDVAGFPEHGGYTPAMSDAVYRKISAGPPPAPLRLLRPEEISRLDANLVQIDADLRQIRAAGEDLLLVLDWNGLEVNARLRRVSSAALDARCQPGSRVQVTGICLAGQTDFARPTGLWLADDLQLWLRTPADVVVVRAAPWLTTGRALGLAIGVSVAALLALAVMAVLARRQIVQREGARKLAEAEFAAMLAERNRLAREIHDTLAQDLNAVSMQLELARNAAKTGDHAVGGYLAAAHRIVRQCLASARESIWDMRSHILERQDLVGALRSVAEQLRGGIPCEIRTQVTGTPRRLAPKVENNLLRIGQEAVANALKHARPTEIVLTFVFDAAGVRLSVSDNGEGIADEPRDGPAGHFGLRGMRERVAQMQGEFRVARRAGGGTAVEVSVAAPGHA